MDLLTPKEAQTVVTRALEAGTSPEGLPAAQMLRHGSLTLYFYQPRGEDHQPPHEQDEVYVVRAGCGSFVQGNADGQMQRRRFGPGDAIFVPAGTIHRFEDFTDDFETWVIMYGPAGGEAPDTARVAS